MIVKYIFIIAQISPLKDGTISQVATRVKTLETNVIVEYGQKIFYCFSYCDNNNYCCHLKIACCLNTLLWARNF